MLIINRPNTRIYRCPTCHWVSPIQPDSPVDPLCPRCYASTQGEREKTVQAAIYVAVSFISAMLGFIAGRVWL